MFDYIDVGPTPCDEEFEQIGPFYDAQKALSECRRYIAAIRSTLGPEPEGARLVIRNCPHDFGTYCEVAVRYDTDNDEAAGYAFGVGDEAPARWPENTPMGRQSSTVAAGR